MSEDLAERVARLEAYVYPALPLDPNEDETAFYRRVGENLREARVRRGLYQSDIAQALGYQSSTAISHIEAGVRHVSLFNLVRMASLLETSAAALLDMRSSDD